MAIQPASVQREASWAGWRIPLGPAARVFYRLANARYWGVYLSVALAACLLALVAIRELDALVVGMHLPGEPSAGLRRLATNPAQASEVVVAWRRFAAAAGPGFADARFVLGLRLVVDTVFVVAYVTAASILLLRAPFRSEMKRAMHEGTRRRALLGGANEAEAFAVAENVARERSLIQNFVLDLSFLGVLVLGFVSWLENGLFWSVLRAYWDASPADPGGGWGPVIVALRGLVLVKWALLGLVVLPMATFGLRYALHRRGAIGTVLRLVRVQLLLAVAFAGVALAPVQIPDVILRLDRGKFGIALGLTVVFGVVSWAFSRRMVLHAAWRREHPAPPRLRYRYPGLFLLGVLAVAGYAVVRVVDAMGGSSGPAMVPVAIAAVVVGLGWLLGEVPRERVRPADPGLAGDALPRLLGAGVVAALGLGIVRATIGPMVYARRWEELGRVGWGLLAGVVGLALFWVLRRLDDREEGGEWRGWWRGFLLVVVVVALGPVIALWALILARPFTVPPVFGALGILAAFGVALALVTGGLTVLSEWFSERFGVPRALRVLRFRRVPVLTLLVVWALVAGRVNGADHLAVRTQPALVTMLESPRGMTLEEAFFRWQGANGALRFGLLPSTPPGQSREAVPLVLVAAAGGGIRAATWTALVVDCLFEADPVLPDCGDQRLDERRASRMFLGSGVSGGSLGLAEYVTELRNRLDGRPPAEDWIDERMGDDYLSAPFAWGLFIEGPRLFLGYDAMDRAEVLERTWERSWGGDPEDSPLGRGFLGMQLTSPTLPLLLLNGTSVRDGCLVNTSVLRLSLPAGREVGSEQAIGGCQSLEPFSEPFPSSDATGGTGDAVLPGATDLLDYLCSNEDVAVSTAVGLSARFPGASPTGRLDACAREGKTGASFVVDGGYIELSGAETVMGLWPRLADLIAEHNERQNAACVVPFFVQIDNLYLQPPVLPKTSAPNELIAPLSALTTAARAARTNRAKAAAAFTFARKFAGDARLDGTPLVDRFAHLVPLAHPGIEAPLGWSLSEAAKEDLRAQLTNERNLAEIREVRSWLGHNLTCG